VFDRNRGRLLSAVFRLVPTLARHPRVADGAPRKLIEYRHLCRFVDAATEALGQDRRLSRRRPRRASPERQLGYTS
jgi:hypothetical protein